MRALINYIRQCFCKHKLEYDENYHEHNSDWRKRSGTKVSATCKECGYHKSYWKFQ